MIHRSCVSRPNMCAHLCMSVRGWAPTIRCHLFTRQSSTLEVLYNIDTVVFGLCNGIFEECIRWVW